MNKLIIIIPLLLVACGSRYKRRTYYNQAQCDVSVNERLVSVECSDGTTIVVDTTQPEELSTDTDVCYGYGDGVELGVVCDDEVIVVPLPEQASDSAREHARTEFNCIRGSRKDIKCNNGGN